MAECIFTMLSNFVDTDRMKYIQASELKTKQDNSDMDLLLTTATRVLAGTKQSKYPQDYVYRTRSEDK